MRSHCDDICIYFLAKYAGKTLLSYSTIEHRLKWASPISVKVQKDRVDEHNFISPTSLAMLHDDDAVTIVIDRLLSRQDLRAKAHADKIPMTRERKICKQWERAKEKWDTETKKECKDATIYYIRLLNFVSSLNSTI